MPPSQEKIDKLRTLYIQRDMLWKQLDPILDEIGRLLREETDYQRWLEDGGQTIQLPDWIHAATGGRPLYQVGSAASHYKKPKTQPREKQQSKQEKFASDMLGALMKGFK